MADAGDPVVILGAGLTGLSAALHLYEGGRSYRLLERDDRVGGKARSERHEGYTFDVTGHWLHLRDARVQALVQQLFEPGELVRIERKTGIYTHGAMLPYPFQANLHGLPREVLRECLLGFVQARIAVGDARHSPPNPPASFEAFVHERFGPGIAKHFFIPYNTKLWGVHPDQLTAAWVSRFVPIPDVEQVISGALGFRQDGLGYNATFSYPKAGGIDALPRALARALGPEAAIELQTTVSSIDAKARRVRVIDTRSSRQTWVGYRVLVSTMPLPELVARISDVPEPVRAAASRLRAVPWRYLDVATRSKPAIDEHWVYVPDPAIPFFRVGIYSNAVPAMAKPGGTSLYVELADREGPIRWELVWRHLAQMGAITGPEDVLFAHERRIEAAYVIFDEHHEAATKTILGWLESVGIRSCGRYGAWTYNSMEDSIIAGMEAASWAEG